MEVRQETIQLLQDWLEWTANNFECFGDILDSQVLTLSNRTEYLLEKLINQD